MSEKKLMSCPFCGGKNIINTYTNFVPSLLCGGCGARMIVPMDAWGKDYEKMLLDKWNTRVPMQKIVERLEELQKENFEKFEDYKTEEEACLYLCHSNAYANAIEIVKEEGM